MLDDWITRFVDGLEDETAVTHHQVLSINVVGGNEESTRGESDSTGAFIPGRPDAGQVVTSFPGLNDFDAVTRVPPTRAVINGTRDVDDAGKRVVTETIVVGFEPTTATQHRVKRSQRQAE